MTRTERSQETKPGRATSNTDNIVDVGFGGGAVESRELSPEVACTATAYKPSTGKENSARHFLGKKPRASDRITGDSIDPPLEDDVEVQVWFDSMR